MEEIQLHPLILQTLEVNSFQLKEVLRYGPRFVTLHIHSGEREGLFKMVLPEAEQTTTASTAILSQRVIKEAAFLQFFSSQLEQYAFEPKVLAYDDNDGLAWSLRTYISQRSMSAWGSNFIFRPLFFEKVKAATVVDFFYRLQRLSDSVPEPLREMIQDYRSTLRDTARIDSVAGFAAQHPKLSKALPAILKYWRKHSEYFTDSELVITHYEPYSCHLFIVNDQIGFIDWENVGWGHKYQDLTVLWMRCFDHHEWQADYLTHMDKLGYFKGTGQLYWDTEVLIQSLANIDFFENWGPVGTAEYDRTALAFFYANVDRILSI